MSFTQAVSTAPYTTNSHASIFTGCYPPAHNVRAYFSTKLSPSVRTLAEVLKEKGYATLHSFDGAYMFEATGLNRGGPRGSHTCLHKGVTRFLNGRFRNFIKGLRERGVLDENSLLVVFSDHGEACYGQDFTHGGVLLEDVIRIPLFFSCPAELPSGVTVEKQVSAVDIMPTVLDLAGIEYAGGGDFIQGRSLLPVIKGVMDFEPSPAYSEYWSETIDADLMRKKALDGRGDLLGVEHMRDKRWQQSLRTPEVKFIFNNTPQDIPDAGTLLAETKRLDSGEFIREAYRRILLREADPGGFDNAKRHLDRGMERTQFLQALYNSTEYKNLNGRLMVDLRSMDEQERWTEITGPYLSRFEEAKRVVEEISSIKPPEEEKISFADSDEQEKIMNRLRDLGYIE